MVFADLKSVGLLAIVELGLASFLVARLDPPVHAEELFPPPTRGLGMDDCASVSATVAPLILWIQTESVHLNNRVEA